MIDTEKNEDNNYNNFNLNKISKILSIDENKFMPYSNDYLVFILRDGRIIVYMHHLDIYKKDYNFVLDLKNKSIFDLNLNYIYDIIQMDDDVVIAATDSGIVLMEIKKDEAEIIKTLDLSDYKKEDHDFYKLVRCSNNKVLLFIYRLGLKRYQAFIYEKKDIKSLYNKSLESTEDTYIYISQSKMCLINENEIAINYKRLGIFGDSYYISIFDIKNDKMIQTFTVKSSEDPFALINDYLFIVATKRKLYPYYIKKK